MNKVKTSPCTCSSCTNKTATQIVKGVDTVPCACQGYHSCKHWSHLFVMVGSMLGVVHVSGMTPVYLIMLKFATTPVHGVLAPHTILPVHERLPIHVSRVRPAHACNHAHANNRAIDPFAKNPGSPRSLGTKQFVRLRALVATCPVHVCAMVCRRTSRSPCKCHGVHVATTDASTSMLTPPTLHIPSHHMCCCTP